MTELDRPLKSLLREPPFPRTEATWSNIQARRRHVWSRRHGVFVLGPAFGFLAALAAVKLGLTSFASAPAPLERADGKALGVLETDATSALIALSDGSRIELDPATRLMPRTVNGHLFATELSRGRAVFDVVPNGPRRWLVAAANVQVTVVGTRFVVERHADVVRVSVERGVVQVTGPDVPGGSRRLGARQSLSVAGARRIANATTPPSAAVPIRQPPAPIAAGSIQPPSGPGDEHDDMPEHDNEHEYTHGHGHGVERTALVATQDADAVVQLLSQADAARLSGRHKQAASALARVVAHYPNDPRAALAAFTLGQLYLEPLARPAQAARAFEQAQALGLPHALAEEGAARIVEAYARAGLPERARSAAEAYRARFPHGVRQDAVEAWTASP
jgi:TolA-binding protein